jgi:hypothetical protein
MMENFSHILQCLPITTFTSSSSKHFRRTSPFKVQVNFDILVFEGQIDVDALEKWLNLLGHFPVHNFPKGKRSPSHSSRLSPMSNIGGKITGRKVPQSNLEYMGSSPLGIFLWMWSRNNTTLLITMNTNTRDGPHCGQEKSQTMSYFTNNFDTLHTKLGIKEFERNLF